jgi:hypothetical protein
MQQTFTSPVFEKLTKYIDCQDGFFTAHQATVSGYSPQNQSYHVKAGHWEKYARGIFRLKMWPTRHLDLADFEIAYLWTSDRLGKPQGVVSHGSALIAWNFSSLMQRTKVHLTVPKNFRRRSQCPQKVKLHFCDLAQSEIEDKFGFRITSPLRTVLDLLTDPRPSIENKHIREAAEAMVMRGYLLPYHIEHGQLTTKEKELLLAVMRKINYHPSYENTVQSIIGALVQKNGLKE